MKRVQFAAAYPERLVHPLHRRGSSSGPVTRAELLTWSPTADATTLFWCDADADATASVVRVVDSLVEKELVEDGDGTYAFLRQDGYEFAPAVLDAIAAAHVVFLPPVVFLDTGDVRFEAVGEAAALGARSTRRSPTSATLPSSRSTSSSGRRRRRGSPIGSETRWRRQSRAGITRYPRRGRRRRRRGPRLLDEHGRRTGAEGRGSGDPRVRRGRRFINRIEVHSPRRRSAVSVTVPSIRPERVGEIVGHVSDGLRRPIHVVGAS